MGRKIGNVYNEIGKKHIDSLILKSISLVEDDETEKPEKDVERISKLASESLLTACEKFNKSADYQNYALCQANLGRLMRVKSRCNVDSNELSGILKSLITGVLG